MSRRPASQPDYEWWLEMIHLHGVNLSPWEEDFIESVSDQVKAGRPLSEKQIAIVERIYAERTA